MSGNNITQKLEKKKKSKCSLKCKFEDWDDDWDDWNEIKSLDVCFAACKCPVGKRRPYAGLYFSFVQSMHV